MSIHRSIVSSISSRKNPNPPRRLNILTFVTHEAYQYNWRSLPHNIYCVDLNDVKKWDTRFRPLPDNYTILAPKDADYIRFDIVLSQLKPIQFNVSKDVAFKLNIPLVHLEHTLPIFGWLEESIMEITNMRANHTVYISEYSRQKWFEKNTSSVIHHGVDTSVFDSNNAGHNDGKVLTVVNDYITRDHCCGFAAWHYLSDKFNMNPIGKTDGLSKPAGSLEELVSAYRNTSVFLNTSLVSPIPTSLLEAMSCGAPVVTTGNCMIPEIIRHGYNGLIANSDKEMEDAIKWCFDNKEEAAVMGQMARKTIEDKFSVESHVGAWDKLFTSLVGKGYLSNV